jgi:hypothetical protein
MIVEGYVYLFERFVLKGLGEWLLVVEKNKG